MSSEYSSYPEVHVDDVMSAVVDSFVLTDVLSTVIYAYTSVSSIAQPVIVMSSSAIMLSESIDSPPTAVSLAVLNDTVDGAAGGVISIVNVCKVTIDV